MSAGVYRESRWTLVRRIRAACTGGVRETGFAGPASPVRLLVTRPATRLRPGMLLGQAARAMREAEVSAALVGQGEAIVTEGDLTRALAAGLGPEAPLSAATTADPIAVDPDLPVVQAAEEMIRRRIRHLVVRDRAGSVQGIVSLRDVLLVLIDAMDPAVWVVTLRRAVTGHGEVWLG